MWICVSEIGEGWANEEHLLKVQHHSTAVFFSVLSAFFEIVWLLSHGAEPGLINLAGIRLAPHRTRSGLESCQTTPVAPCEDGSAVHKPECRTQGQAGQSLSHILGYFKAGGYGVKVEPVWKASIGQEPLPPTQGRPRPECRHKGKAAIFYATSLPKHLS